MMPDHIDNGESIASDILGHFSSHVVAYHVPNWEVHFQLCRTNLASNAPCRSPGIVSSLLVHAATLVCCVL